VIGGTSRRFATTTTRLREAASHNKDLVALLDESVLLSSQVELLSSSSLSSNEEVAKELQHLRTSEVTALIKDIAYALNNNHDNSADDEEEEEEDGAPPTTTTLSDISQQLDEAILDGYQSTFTVAEFDEWTQHIETLYTDFQSKLVDSNNNRLLAPAASEESLMTKVVDQLETRLEQLRTLIAPRSTVFPRIPMATLGDQSPASTEETKLGQPETETFSDPTSKESSFLKAPTTSTKEEGSFFMDVVEVESPSASESESGNSTTPDEGFDTVTAVVSVAAIGAMAVTKLPFIAAGIALGPLLKLSIAHVQNALNQ
jgi:hypothetical protein